MRNSGFVAALAATALVLTACGSSDSGEDGVTTLTINVFGDSFSLKDNRSLYDEYEKAHKGSSGPTAGTATVPRSRGRSSSSRW